MTGKTRVLLTYCKKDYIIADIIVSVLLASLDIHILRDTHEGSRKLSYENPSRNINDYKIIVHIISDSYLKSKTRMCELAEMTKARGQKDKHYFIVLSNKEKKYYRNAKYNPAALLKKASDQLAYTSYWKSEYFRLSRLYNNKTDNPDPKLKKELNEVRSVYNKILTSFFQGFKNYNSISFKKLAAKKYKPLIYAIEPKTRCANYDIRLSEAYKVGSASIYYNYLSWPRWAAKRPSKHGYPCDKILSLIKTTGKKLYTNVLMEASCAESGSEGLSMIVVNDFMTDWKTLVRRGGRIEFDSFCDQNVKSFTFEVKNTDDEEMNLIISEEIDVNVPCSVNHHSIPLITKNPVTTYSYVDEIRFAVFPNQLKSPKGYLGIMNLRVVCDK